MARRQRVSFKTVSGRSVSFLFRLRPMNKYIVKIQFKEYVKKIKAKDMDEAEKKVLNHLKELKRKPLIVDIETQELK